VPVNQHYLDGTLIIYPSISQASKFTGINSGTIYNACNGKCQTAGGYKWSLKIDEN